VTVRGADRFDTEWLLTMRHVAQRLNVSYRTVERLVASGELPATRVRHLVRIDPRDLRAYIEARTQEAAPTSIVATRPGIRPHGHRPQRRNLPGSAQPSFLDELAAVER
jgi:excisionase family DNA binding protein